RARAGEAGAEAEAALTKAPRNDGRVLYAAACAWALACRAAAAEPDLARRYADRAAELLAEALDRGFHDLDYPDHNRMPHDPALASVRDHPRVRALLGNRPRVPPPRKPPPDGTHGAPGRGPAMLPGGPAARGGRALPTGPPGRAGQRRRPAPAGRARPPRRRARRRRRTAPAGRRGPPRRRRIPLQPGR